MVKRFYDSKVGQLRDYLPKFDALDKGKDINGKPVVISATGKKTSLMPQKLRRYRG